MENSAQREVERAQVRTYCLLVSFFAWAEWPCILLESQFLPLRKEFMLGVLMVLGMYLVGK
jgi:hypothetical protein